MLWSDIKHTDEERQIFQFSVTVLWSVFALIGLFIYLSQICTTVSSSRSKYCVTDGLLLSAIGSNLTQAG